MYRIVQSEAGDWYIIPADKFDEWKNDLMYTYEGDEDWVNYVGYPHDILIVDYKR